MNLIPKLMYKSPRVTLKQLRLINYTPAFYSTKPAIKEEAGHDDNQVKKFQRISNISQKLRTKKPQKPPFVKNLLLGIFDTDILTYPELHKDNLKELEEALRSPSSFLQQPEIKDCTTLNRQFLQKLAKEKLLGLQVSQLMDGRELSVTEICRFSEAISEIKLKNSIIANEQLGIQALTKFGNDEQKRLYLEPLVRGEALSAFCVVENFPSNEDVLNRTAILSDDSKTWVLNGETKFVINGSTADTFIVIAQSNSVVKDALKEHKLTAFVVERDFGGITSSQCNTVASNLEISHVTFDNVHIPAGNVLGTVESGEQVLSTIYPEQHLSTGPICAALNRNLINRATDHYIKISKEPALLFETDLVRANIAAVSASTYAIESMIYLTSGLMDNYENQDCELEATIVKVFASEQTFLNTATYLNALGPQTSLENDWCTQLHKEAMCYINLPDSNDNLKVIIALFGLRYAGQHLNELVKKLRNPLHHAAFVLKRMWTHSRQTENNPRLNLFLNHYLHPSCIEAANSLEYCVLRLQYATEVFLSRNGQEVVSRHMDLQRLAECLIDIYAMTACLGRASRSYCIGLQHGSYEMGLAGVFCLSATERVKTKLKEIIDGQYFTNDDNYRTLAKRVFKFKQYFPVHPLTRNF